MATTEAGPTRSRRRRPAAGTSRPTRAPWRRDEPWLLALSRTIVCIGFALLVLVPLWMVVATSLAGPSSSTGAMVLWPREISLQAYRQVLGTPRLPRAFWVSVGVTLVGTLLATTVTALAAYGLSRPGSLWHRRILFTILLSHLFGPGLIPVYLVVRATGLYDSLASVVLTGSFWAFNMVILRGFFMAIPREVVDAARIDGAGHWRTLASIVLPLSRAPLAVVALFYGVAYWNNYFAAFLYLDDAQKFPLQLVLRDVLLFAHPISRAPGGPHLFNSTSVEMAVLVVATLPVLAVLPLVQRHFTKGALTGAVKG